MTTLHDYEPVILKNALIYSDNIYFAKAALKIGADQLMQSLNQIGFNQELPFDIKMSESQYSNTDKIETEIQLADSGYGQGQILVNPLHLASIYTAFLNDGNMIKPYLHADGGSTSSEIWIKDAFSPQIVSEVMEGLEGVVNNPEGTGYGACREDIRLAGKTGTAEKLPRGNGDYLLSFIGYAPQENPQVMVYVVIDEPNVDNQANSKLATTMASQIMTEIFPKRIYPKAERKRACPHALK